MSAKTFVLGLALLGGSAAAARGGGEGCPAAAARGARRRGVPATSLAGAPEGQYVVIQYDTDFASVPDMVETITAMLEPDGQWRVVGYQIKSAAEIQQQMQQQQDQQPPADQPQDPPR